MKTKYINIRDYKVTEHEQFIKFFKMIRGKFILINCHKKEL